MQQTSSTPFFAGATASRPVTGEAVAADLNPPVTFLRGRKAILRAQPLLASLAAGTDQAGEADSLAYFLSTPDAIPKTPHLLLIGDPAERCAGPRAAVLLFEYRASAFGARVFATADSAGRRNVLAPPGQRARMAAFAARTLIQRGAQLVHLAFCEDHCSSEQLPQTCSGSPLQTIAAELHFTRPSARWTLQEQQIPAFLPLLPTFNATLARIGAKTRFNLRYYRRRCEQHHGCSFVAAPRLSQAEFLAFNRECTYAVSNELATFRYHALQTHPSHIMRGIRDAGGRWLSLVGTRRHNTFVELDWQMNRAELPALSLATVMRSFLIEHEVDLGSTRLYIEGGTPQYIAGSFLRRRIGELTVARNSRYTQLLRRFAPRIFPPKNYIRQTLRNPELQWQPC